MNFPTISDATRFAGLQPPKGKVNLVIDTDTYNEIDDQFAVVHALLSPEPPSPLPLAPAPVPVWFPGVAVKPPLSWMIRTPPPAATALTSLQMLSVSCRSKAAISAAVVGSTA